MKAILKPLYNMGKIELYDIYINGKWIGSRRTIKQCFEDIKAFKKDRKDDRS